MVKLVANRLKDFIESEKSGGLLLFVCTFASLLITNATVGDDYLNFWHKDIGGHTITQWINDGLMAIFFLMVGLEIMNEVEDGELSSWRTALLPISGALGGMIVPAFIYLYFNWGLDTQNGFGIPIATDLAFTLAILSLFSKRVPFGLKIFLTAFSILDDVGGIIVIVLFYTESLAWIYLTLALSIFVILLVLNRKFNVTHLAPYLIGGIAMWYFMLNSGVHATLAGILLAVTIPFRKNDKNCLSVRMQNWLHYPVAYIILPIFALANMAINIEGKWDQSLGEPFAMGIILGLLVGKPIGITLFSYLSVKTKMAKLPEDTNWKEIFGVGLIGGVGFTMSIFITLLSFADYPEIENAAKLIIMLTSILAGIIGYAWLNFVLKKDSELNDHNL